MTGRTALAALAEHHRGAWAGGCAQPPREPMVLLAAVRAGQPLRVLEWLHLLRHKPALDAHAPDRGLADAAAIWRASTRDPALMGLLLEQLAAGLCGREGLCAAMRESFHTARPLADAEPRLQAVIAALLVLQTEPGVLLDLLIHQQRTPRALLLRVGLPESLPILPALLCALPDALHRTPAAQSWLLACLPELSLTEQDRVAEVVLEMTGLEALHDVMWWLKSGYGYRVAGSRWRWLSVAALERLKSLG